MSALLEVSGVSKSFGGVHALSACHLELSDGAIHGLIGPNGSGKTTLFNVITGYERIQQGEVRFNGSEITNAPPDRVFALGHRPHVPADADLRAADRAREHARRDAALTRAGCAA